MSNPFSTARKLTATVGLLLHLLVSGVVPLVHGAVPEGAVELGMLHIEAEGDDACPPAHDDLACQLCRILSRDLVVVSPTAVVAPAAATGDISAPSFVFPACPGGSRLAVDSRAPPIV